MGKAGNRNDNTCESNGTDQNGNKHMDKKSIDQTATIVKGNKRPENENEKELSKSHEKTNRSNKGRQIQRLSQNRKLPSYCRKGYEIIADADNTQPESMLTLSPAIAESTLSRLAAMRTAEAENESRTEEACLG